jgi:antitoxin component of RelBE/YafQ-DinJ toxin-antitoxin module
MSEFKKQRTFISFEIDPVTKEQFSQRLKAEGKTVTGVLKQFVEDYLTTEEPENQDLTEVIKRLEEVEKKVGIENTRLLGEFAA